VLCSFGRARAITSPLDVPAVVDAHRLAEMLREWSDAVVPRGRAERATAARLDAMLRSLSRPRPEVARAVRLLDPAAEPSPARRIGGRTPAPHQDSRPMPTRRRRRRRRELRNAAARTLTYAGVAIVASQLRVPSGTDGVTSTDGIASWLTDLAGVLRWTVVVVAAYAAAMSLAWAVAVAGERRGLAERVRRLTPTWLHRLVVGAAVVGAVSSSAANALPGAKADPAAVTLPHDPGASPTPLPAERSPATTAPPTTTPPSTVIPSTTAPAAVSSTTTISSTTTPTPTEPAPVTGEPPTAAGSTMPTTALPIGPGAGPTWTVRPGDHLWRIAEQTLTAAWGRTPDNRDVDRYWRQLIATNRDRLRDPRNPDLVFVGQVFVLPPAPAAA
jgi:hypothetical protein